MDTDKTKFSSSMEEIEVAVKSLSPYVWVRTHEEQRFIKDFAKVMTDNKREVLVWSLYQGIVSPELSSTGELATGKMSDTKDPIKALAAIMNLQPSISDGKGVVVILRDPQLILQGPVVRQLRDCYTRLKERRVTILFLSSELGHGAGGKSSGLPSSMEKEIVVVDFNLPNLEQINKMIRELVRQTARVNVPDDNMSKERQEKLAAQLEILKFSKETYYEFSRALQGLTHTEVDVAVSSCLHHMRTLDMKFLLQTKKQIISRSDILEYIDNTKDISEIGGMDLTKEFFEDYTENHTAEAQAFGAEPLKAVLLVGIPGCGKSILCKAVSSIWKTPLLRMDVGKVMTGLVGGSESRMREAIKQVEAVAPCVTGDTMVRLQNGSEISAKDLFELQDCVDLKGANVDSFEEQPVKMHAIIRRAAEDKVLLKITAGNKSIKVTDNHKLLTKRGWVEAKDLNEDDFVLME